MRFAPLREPPPRRDRFRVEYEANNDALRAQRLRGLLERMTYYNDTKSPRFDRETHKLAWLLSHYHPIAFIRYRKKTRGRARRIIELAQWLERTRTARLELGRAFRQKTGRRPPDHILLACCAAGKRPPNP